MAGGEDSRGDRLRVDREPMSKLLVAIVHRDDAEPTADALRRGGHRFTRLASSGGFLGQENTTFLIATEDAGVEAALACLAEACQPREVEVPLVLLERLADWKARTVAHGGATVLVVDLERVVRL